MIFKHSAQEEVPYFFRHNHFLFLIFKDCNINQDEMPKTSEEIQVTQPLENCVSTPVIVPTGPQIIQVPVMTSPVVPQPSCSLIILQPQLPIMPMQQQPPMLPSNAMYLPQNGMMHLNYASQLPNTLHPFPTILPPNTFICTQDTSGVAMPNNSQAFPVNFSWRKNVRKYRKKCIHCQENFFYFLCLARHY